MFVIKQNLVGIYHIKYWTSANQIAVFAVYNYDVILIIPQILRSAVTMYRWNGVTIPQLFAESRGRARGG